jgi:hypothetical protein
MTHPQIPWILTHTSRRVQLDPPRLDDICLVDIVHALARINRYTGHGECGLTDAQHCCIVHDLCPPERKRWGLLHDAEEAYTGDWSSPVKRLIDQWCPEAKAWRLRWRAAVAQRFGLFVVDVAIEDTQAMLWERRENGPWGCTDAEYCAGYKPVHSPPTSKLSVWSPEHAEAEYWYRLHALGIRCPCGEDCRP